MRPEGELKAQHGVIVRRHRPDYLVLLYMGLLMLLGLVVIYAIGPQRANVLNNAYGSDYSDSYFFLKQVVSIGAALAAFAVTALVPKDLFVRIGPAVFITGLLACLLLAIASFGGWAIAQEALGATRWFNLGPLSFQPAELLKFGLLLYLGGFLGIRSRQGKINDLHQTIIPAVVLLALSLLFIVVLQRDLGTGIAMTAIAFAMIFMAGINKKTMLIALAVAVGVGILFVLSAPHRIERVMTFFQGDSASIDSEGGYHIQHAKIAIGSGGLFGVGIGNSVQATGYLPEAINDSVFAIIGEVFGFVGLMALLALFMGLLLRMLKIMDHTVDIEYKLIVAGVFGWFGAHVILNIAAMIGIFPLTGITLPLLSFGGTSMMFIAAALGLVFQISRHTIHSSRLSHKEAQSENSLSRRGVGRTRHTSRRSTSGN
ncbi:MAG TPA: FtsW/RodA/SpoVE family cell cycle protein [Candidatus Saccharibacteria bacterium]|nr:FtsW/RodA/SpoVE family cell cycle protein [Candidatus Saccharibacteria bacterium]